jgi:hypothetical protein
MIVFGDLTAIMNDPDRTATGQRRERRRFRPPGNHSGPSGVLEA